MKITEFLNSQTPIRDSYFIANHPIVRDLQDQLLEKRCFLERQVNEYQYMTDRGIDIKGKTVMQLEKNSTVLSPTVLYDILSDIWCADTCAPRLREEWSEENKTLGQCSITAFLAQDIFGGKVYGILRPGGNYHCYNVVGDCCFDLTSEQFGEEAKDLVYENNPEQYREIHFAKEEKRQRYEMLKSELKKRCESGV